MAKKSKLIGNPVNHPKHYTSHPSGIEAIEVCGRMRYNTGCAFKYLYRLDKKWDSLEDLRKTRWYINREGFQSDAQFAAHHSTPDMAWADWYFGVCIDKVPPDSNIAKIVKNTPGNVGKAILFVYLADKTQDQPMMRTYLVYAKTFVNAEIRKRLRAKRIAKRKRLDRVRARMLRCVRALCEECPSYEAASRHNIPESEINTDNPRWRWNIDVAYDFHGSIFDEQHIDCVECSLLMSEIECPEWYVDGKKVTE